MALLRKIVNIVPPSEPVEEWDNLTIWQVTYEDGKGGTYRADLPQKDFLQAEAIDKLARLPFSEDVMKLIEDALGKTYEAAYTTGQDSMMDD